VIAFSASSASDFGKIGLFRSTVSNTGACSKRVGHFALAAGLLLLCCFCAAEGGAIVLETSFEKSKHSCDDAG
jgi:hypothetical protein